MTLRQLNDKLLLREQGVFEILHPVDRVKLRLYTRLSIEQTAGFLRVSAETVERECTKARVQRSPPLWEDRCKAQE